MLWTELEELEADARRRKLAPVSAAAFRLILLTAQRPGEVFSMRWRDIEDGAWWVIPAEVAKNGEANRVYLSPAIARVVCPFVPGRYSRRDWRPETKATIPITDAMRPMLRPYS